MTKKEIYQAVGQEAGYSSTQVAAVVAGRRKDTSEKILPAYKRITNQPTTIKEVYALIAETTNYSVGHVTQVIAGRRNDVKGTITPMFNKLKNGVSATPTRDATLVECFDRAFSKKETAKRKQTKNVRAGGVGDLIKQMRERRNLTQEELADGVYCDVSTIISAEADSRTCSLNTFFNILNYLRVETEFAFRFL